MAKIDIRKKMALLEEQYHLTVADRRTILWNLAFLNLAEEMKTWRR